MTPAQVERLVRSWQETLGLSQWSVVLVWDEPCSDDENAKTWRSDFYEQARMYFASDFASWSAARTEQTVVHELLHLLHRDVDETFNDIEGQLQRDAWIMVDRRYKQTMEGFIDRLACRLVEIGGSA